MTDDRLQRAVVRAVVRAAVRAAVCRIIAAKEMAAHLHASSVTNPSQRVTAAGLG